MNVILTIGIVSWAAHAAWWFAEGDLRAALAAAVIVMLLAAELVTRDRRA